MEEKKCKNGHIQGGNDNNKETRRRCVECKYEYTKAYKLAHPDVQRKADRKRKDRESGWTDERFEKAMKEQGGCCANEACGVVLTFEHPITESRCCRDHEHDRLPPKPRGLLCNRCNRMLGVLEDNTDHMSGLLSYLRKYGK
jgi:hypothetical protein